MKITQVILSDGWGGAERLFVELCTGLARSGHDVQAICRSSFTMGSLLFAIPGVALETVLARGKPIVSTVTSRPAEILDSSTAYFARPGDSQDLYGAICKATEDDRGRNLKAQKALDLFKSKYTLEKILPVFMDYYSFMAASMTKGSKHSNKTLP